MSDDLIARLRYLAKDTEAYESKAMSEAADEIERLRAALRIIDNIIPKDDTSIPVFLVVAGDVAEAALNGTWPAFGVMPRAALATGREDER